MFAAWASLPSLWCGGVLVSAAEAAVSSWSLPPGLSLAFEHGFDVFYLDPILPRPPRLPPTPGSHLYHEHVTLGNNSGPFPFRKDSSVLTEIMC